MLRYIFAIIIVVHALIHLMGFQKSLKPASISALSVTISKPVGLMWLLTCVLFISAVIFMLVRSTWWWIPAAIALVVSQILILMNWHHAKAGTIANVIILLVLSLVFAD